MRNEKLVPDVPRNIKWDGKLDVALPSSVEVFLEDFHHDRAAIGVIVVLIVACLIIRTVGFIFQSRK